MTLIVGRTEMTKCDSYCGTKPIPRSKYLRMKYIFDDAKLVCRRLAPNSPKKWEVVYFKWKYSTIFEMFQSWKCVHATLKVETGWRLISD